MEQFGTEIAYPTLEQIIEVNRRMIESSGGSFIAPHNLNNLNALEYILDAISYPVFSHNLYKSLKEKAAALTFEIISSHVFTDGNKRTGIHIAWEFLKSNNVPVYLDSTVEDLAVNIAIGTSNYEDFLKWLNEHQE